MYESATADLAIEFRAGRLLITMDRPAQANRLNYAMLEAITAACREAGDDDSVRVVALRGSGGTFSAGDDFEAMGELPDRFASRVPRGAHGPAPIVEQEALKALRNLMKPTVALIQGAAMGLAFDLAAVCDVRFAARSASLGDDRIDQARAASTGISYVLPRLIGQSQATRILLLGESLSADEAHRISLVHRVVDDGAFDAEAESLLAEVAALPTRAWEVHKKQVLPQLDLGFDAAMTHCLGVRQTHVIEDQQEGRLAWRERRDPVFTGR